VRVARRSGIHLGFGPAFDMEHFEGSDISIRQQRREARTHAIWKSIDALYQKFP
jgi:hypothetical protein